MKADEIASNSGETRSCIIAIVAILSVAAVIFALLLSPLPSSRDKSSLPFDPESDGSAIQFFLTHQDSFEQLREIIEKKKTLVYYDLERDETSPPNAFADDGQDQDRQVIRQLMTDLGLEALNGPASDWGLRMIFHGEGMVMSSTTKSFYFSRQTPTRVVPSIENFVIDAPESEGVYRNMVPNWYLKMGEAEAGKTGPMNSFECDI